MSILTKLRGIFDILLYMKIKKELNLKNDEAGFLANAHIGDTFELCGFIKAFKKEHKIKKVVIVTNKTNSYVAKLFPAVDEVIIKNYLPHTNINGFLNLFYTPGPGVLAAGSPFNIGLIKYTNFTSLDFSRTSLFLDEKTKFSKPIKVSKKELDIAHKIFEKQNIKVEKAIMVFPKGYTFSNIDINLWRKIEKILCKMGYTVIENVKPGDKKVLKSTIQFSFDPNTTRALVEACGKLIGTRSGMMEFLYFTGAKKVIFYPTTFAGLKYGRESVLHIPTKLLYSFNSLSRMYGKSNSIKEVIPPKKLKENELYNILKWIER